MTNREKALTERVAELEEALMQIREEIDTILGRREEEEDEDEEDFEDDEDEDLDEDFEEDEDYEDEEVYE